MRQQGETVGFLDGRCRETTTGGEWIITQRDKQYTAPVALTLIIYIVDPTNLVRYKKLLMVFHSVARPAFNWFSGRVERRARLWSTGLG